MIGTGALAVGLAQGGIARAQDSKIPDYTVPEHHLPREMRIKNKLDPYEIHVDPNQFALFWTLPNRKAIRYSVGIGKPGLYEPGEFYVGRKREWPSWKPTESMIERNPSYEKYADGVKGGIDNPLGARALYLYYVNAQRDSMLRIHGTNDPRSLGRAVSNGCARMLNTHVIDLYNRVPEGTRVVLYPIGATSEAAS